MSNYGNILRTSRLMALPPTIKSSSPQNLHPLSPSIRTTRACQNVGDWGLKRDLPRIRTDNIVIGEIDTQEHQTPFESGNRYTRVVQRWQEMGIPTQMDPRKFLDTLDREASRPENVNKGIHLNSLPHRELPRLVRKARHLRSSFLASQGADQPTVYSNRVLHDMTRRAHDYLGIVPSTSRTFTVQPNAGLAYHPHGALSLVNTPKGPQERTLTARVLQSGRSTTYVGLGGILSELKERHDSVPNRKEGRANTVKIYAATLDVQHNGALNLSVQDVRPNQFDRARASGVNPYLQQFPDTPFGGRRGVGVDEEEQGYEDGDMEPSEKSLLPSLSSPRRGRKTAGSAAVFRLGNLLESSPASQTPQEKGEGSGEKDGKD